MHDHPQSDAPFAERKATIVVCRWAFLVLCVVPTLATCGFIAVHWLTLCSPAAKAEWERELSGRLGVTVAIEGLSYPQPSLAELAGLTLADPETKLPLGECRRVEIERTPSQWQITLVEPSIARGALPQLVRRIHEWAFVAAREDAPPLRLTATQLVIEGDEQAHCLNHVAATWETTAAGPALAVQFTLLPDEQSPIELRVTRTAQQTPPVTKVEWDCSPPLPCALASSFIPELELAGHRATIAGTGRLLWQEGEWSGELAGQVRGIDLSRLIGERFGHILTGQGNLTLQQATLESGRLASARGTLTASGGRISRSLLAAAQEHLALDAELPPEEEESTSYRKLALRFELTDQGLRLMGADDSQPGMVTTVAGPLLSARPNHHVPAVALVRALVPESQVQVPATKQTAALLRWLPLPAVDPSPSARGSFHMPTRLGPARAADRSTKPIREGSLR